MGGVLSLFRRVKKILILGPSHAGKTTVFDQIAYIHRVKPKVAAHKHFNFVKISNFHIWDLAGESNSVRAWPYYYDNTACVIFVYDSRDSETSERILKDLVYTKELRKAVMLIVVNRHRQDDGEEERIAKIMKRRQYKLLFTPDNQKTVDIKDGFDWISKTV